MTRQSVTRIGRWIFAIAALAYLADFARDSMAASGRSVSFVLRAAIGETTASVPIFMLAALVSLFGWRALLRRLTGHPVGLGPLLKVFCSTQAAKYLPGNVGHHIGRVALARMRLQIPAAITIASILQEGALVVACSLLVGTACNLVAPLALPRVGGMAPEAALAMIVIAGFAALALVNGLRERIGARGNAWVAPLLRLAPEWPAVRNAFAPYVATQLLNGAAVTVIASALLAIDLTLSIQLTGAYALAWMIGFLLPGAPGGLGVRESAFLMLIGHTLAPEVALGITLLSRMGNVAADASILLVGLLLPNKGPTQATFPDAP